MPRSRSMRKGPGAGGYHDRLGEPDRAVPANLPVRHPQRGDHSRAAGAIGSGECLNSSGRLGMVSVGGAMRKFRGNQTARPNLTLGLVRAFHIQPTADVAQHGSRSAAIGGRFEI